MKKTSTIILAITTLAILGYLGFTQLLKPEGIIGQAPLAADQTPAPIEQATFTTPGKPGSTSIIPTESKAVRKFTVSVPDFSQMAANDPVEFFIPHENQTYRGTIDSKNTNESGSRGIIGHFDVEGKAYRFVFTVGQQFTFGTLHTPLGRYQLEGKNGTGVLVSTTEVNRIRDSRKPDYIVPEAVRPLKE